MLSRSSLIRYGGAIGLLSSALACATESVDLSGRWVGRAEWVVDGEQREMPLRWELMESPRGFEGTIYWGELVRTVTSGTREGPEMFVESMGTTTTIRFDGLFRNGAIEGRFTIRQSMDPEPYPGRFRVARDQP